MSQQVNIRMPKLTRHQIGALCQAYGLTKTQVIILAVDRFNSALAGEDEETYHDLRRLKTVSRILPDMDLGQHD